MKIEESSIKACGKQILVEKLDMVEKTLSNSKLLIDDGNSENNFTFLKVINKGIESTDEINKGDVIIVESSAMSHIEFFNFDGKRKYSFITENLISAIISDTTMMKYFM